MPPKKPLPADEVETLATWVKLGAPWPDSALGGGATAGMGVVDAKLHWSFQPVREAGVAAVRNSDGV